MVLLSQAMEVLGEPDRALIAQHMGWHFHGRREPGGGGGAGSATGGAWGGHIFQNQADDLSEAFSCCPCALPCLVLLPLRASRPARTPSPARALGTASPCFPTDREPLAHVLTPLLTPTPNRALTDVLTLTFPHTTTQTLSHGRGPRSQGSPVVPQLHVPLVLPWGTLGVPVAHLEAAPLQPLVQGVGRRHWGLALAGGAQGNGQGRLEPPPAGSRAGTWTVLWLTGL